MTSPYTSPHPVNKTSPAAAGPIGPQRSTPVGPIVFGILNLGYGALTLFGTLFSGVSMVMASRGRGGANPIYDQMFGNPVFRLFLIISLILGSLFAIVLLGAGVGMLMRAWWGRSLSIAYAVYSLVMGVVGMAVNYFVLFQPIVQQAGQAAGPQAVGMKMGVLFGLAGACLGLIYPLVLLVYCLLPSTKQIFRQHPTASPPASGPAASG